MEKISGYVKSIVYQNAQNHYTVLELVSDDREITCVGIFHCIDEGEVIEAQGEFGKHSLYGEQFQVKSYETKAPTDVISVERYLGSGAIPGIGSALAKRMVTKFGEDTFRIIEEEPERLSEIKGISDRKAREIAALMEGKKDLRKAMIFLQQYGISNALAVKIYDRYEQAVYKVISENPYQMAEEITGVGFRIADEIAQKVGIHTGSDYRIRSGILYTLLQATGEGHVYLPMDILTSRAAELLGVEEPYVEDQLLNLMMERKVTVKASDSERQVYATSYYYKELDCAKRLIDLNIKSSEDDDVIRKKTDHLEKELGLILEEKQREAVIEAVRNGVFIITGGPGTGKTTTINMLIRYFAEERMDIFLAAPTGRAAKRMTETTGFEAKTIHRLLELSGNMEQEDGNYYDKNNGFERNEQNPLEADVIIIDEMSMVDIHLFQALLKSITVGTKLIMVGDDNQLPPVGPGAVLKDMILSGKFSTITLEKIFRQENASDIVLNAHRIHEGKSVKLDNKSTDFFFLERDDPEVIMESIIYLVSKKLPPYVKAEPFEIQVMTPMRKGSLGVESLNEKLQEKLNPPSPKKKEKELFNGVFREGDKVMQIKNNYQLEWEIVSKYGITIDKGLGVFNGDLGVIREINPVVESMVVVFDENRQVNYPFRQLEELELAYAITIHKSQGSEYPAIVMPILSGPAMLMNRNLLYTGITRAKKCVTLVGSSTMVQKMIDNRNEQKRYSGLCNRILEICEVEWE